MPPLELPDARPEEITPAARPALSGRAAALGLALLGLVYACLVIPNWNVGYIDFGDGNYMYISWRLAEGAVLYRDVLAPQPPVHLYLGALIQILGQTLLDEPLYAFRAYSLLLHLATMVAVYWVTLRVGGGHDPLRRAALRPAGLLAAIVYLLLPIGFWWTLAYQSEPTEMLFLLGSFGLFLRLEKKPMIAAGALAAFAPLTNMTAAPYVLFAAGWLAVRHPRLLLPYLVPLAAIIGLVIITMELITGAYLENVILNQVGSFPRPEMLPPGENALTYALGKWSREGADIIRLEGGYVVLGLLGLIWYSRRGPALIREYAAWFSFFALCSWIYVAKGGTMDYIFSIGEPFVAVFAGLFLHLIWRHYLGRMPARLAWHDLSPLAGWAAAAMLALAVTWVGLQHAASTLRQATYELPAFETRRVADRIRRATRPDDLILAPPHYAYLARRRIAEDYSELYLWTIKYYNEALDRQPGRATQTAQKIAALLEQKKIPFVVLETGQTGRIPEIMQALEKHYQLDRPAELRTLNTLLKFYKPKP